MHTIDKQADGAVAVLIDASLDIKLITLVLCLAKVFLIGCETKVISHIHIHEQVFGTLYEIVEIAGNPMVEELKVDAEVGLLCALPFEVIVALCLDYGTDILLVSEAAAVVVHQH